jgi:hypothetical protein
VVANTYNAKFFCIVGSNAEKWTNFSSCVFCQVVPYKGNNFLRCGLQREKIIDVVAYTTEK